MAQALSSYVLVRLTRQSTCTQELKANLSNVVVTLLFINNRVLVLTKLERCGGGLQMVPMKALSTAEDSCKKMI